MAKELKVETIIAKNGNGRSTQLQKLPDGLVNLIFRRPIQPEHVKHGCLVGNNVVSRDGTKRTVTLVLDEDSAERAYKVLKAWHDDQVQMKRLASLMHKVISTILRRDFLLNTSEKSFFSRLFCK